MSMTPPASHESSAVSELLHEIPPDFLHDIHLPWFAAESAWLGHLAFARWIIHSLQPRCLVELGVHTGTSFLTFCDAVKDSKIDCQCFGVDTWQGDAHSGRYGEAVYARLSEYARSRYESDVELMRMAFDEAAHRFADGSVDLLHIDGLHFYESVRHDFETWRPKLSQRAIVLFHDTSERSRDFGVWRFWGELSSARPHFAFEHSHGLGVLAVGSDIPAPLAELFAMASEPKKSVEVGSFFEDMTRSQMRVSESWSPAGLHNRLCRRARDFRKWRKARKNAVSSRIGVLPS